MRGTVGKAVWVGLLAAIVVPLLDPTSTRAQGDAEHYQTLQLGERSRGMAAAFTGFAADGAAIWFNPGGLPLLEPRLLQGSLSLVQIRRTDIENAIISDGPDGPGGEDQVEDFQLKSTPALPGFAVASFAVGKPKEHLDNRKPVQIAISAFVLYNDTTGGDINFEDEFGRTNSIQFYASDTVSYFAGGVGHRPVKNFSWGVTLLAANREVEHVETLSFAFGGTQDPSQGSPCPTSPTIPFCILDAGQNNRNTVFTMSNWSLGLRIGVIGLLGKRWRLGLMFQPPFVRVGGKSNLRFELSDVRSSTNPVNPDLSDSVFADIEGNSRSPIPWELRFGASYVISQKVVVAADLQLVGPIAEGSIAPGTPQLEGRANSSGALLTDSTKRDFTWNISLGTEIQITDFLFTRFGFLTDNSSAPARSGTEEFIRPSQIDRYGFSASIGGFKNRKGLSAGVSMLFGSGTGNGLDLRSETLLQEGDVFISTSIKERVFIISVGGDIGQTADVVKDRVKEKKAEQEIEAEREKERQEKLRDMEAEEDPELKAAKQEAIEARQARDEAEARVKEAEKEVERIKAQQKENLDAQDQGAIQQGTQTGIDALR